MWSVLLQGRFKSDFIGHATSIPEGVQYSCKQCNYKAPKKPNLVEYVKSIHKRVQYSWYQCDYKSENKYNLIRNVKLIHDGIQCDYKEENKYSTKTIPMLFLLKLIYSLR